MREKLNLMIKEDSLGIVIRSRFGQNAEEERASLFHAGREMKNSRNNISSLKKGDKILSDRSDIEEEVLSFFNALFNDHHLNFIKL